MSTIFVVIRTFPFWAIPSAVILLTAAFSKKPPKTGKEKMLYLSIAIVLLALSVAFFVFGGHTRAVPFVHAILNKKELR